MSHSITAVGNRRMINGIDDINALYYAMYRYIVHGEENYLRDHKIYDIKEKHLRWFGKSLEYFYQIHLSGKTIKNLYALIS